MYLLDTNLFEMFLLGDESVMRQVRENASRIWLSSVAAEEFLVSRMNALNRARSPRTSLSLPRAHEDFVQALAVLQAFPVFTYSEAAEEIYKTFPPGLIRIGSQDCRIAAQAMAHDLTVVTRNLQDFVKIGAPCEDWSI